MNRGLRQQVALAVGVPLAALDAGKAVPLDTRSLAAPARGPATGVVNAARHPTGVIEERVTASQTELGLLRGHYSRADEVPFGGCRRWRQYPLGYSAGLPGLAALESREVRRSLGAELVDGVSVCHRSVLFLELGDAFNGLTGERGAGVLGAGVPLGGVGIAFGGVLVFHFLDGGKY